jgi:succinate dehydrogenase / fumarate reductase, cytochrome b subunit
MSATVRTRRPARRPPRPVRGPLRGTGGWARGRHLGSVAFFTNRVTGLLLIGYLYLHLGVLYLLTEGSGSWASVLHLFKNHAFIALESLLILFILVHGLNGLRLALVGTGVGVRHHRTWFTAAISVSACLYVVVVLAMFGVI